MRAPLTWNNETDLTATLASRAGIAAEYRVEIVPLASADLEQKLRRAGVAVLDLGDGGYLGLLPGLRNRCPSLMAILSI